ncbi:hypothetical protein PMIN06_010568 [Paraphaeosphaeria minitans]|uniref:Cytochrome P450 n=1 Tax=Paraphaeosphaeria minitans TaxID=565426 RepID=A0A9P6KVE3_9PLEO|nr:hypothetical protein PMIN01_00412 [Paraphaeosphaeria minitans]
MRLFLKRVLSKGLLYFELSKDKLARRRQRRLDYIDILSGWLAAEEKGALDGEDLKLNVPLLMGAGRETTAMARSGATYFIGRTRGCSLALVEMRLIMARLLFEFDVEIMP